MTERILSQIPNALTLTRLGIGLSFPLIRENTQKKMIILALLTEFFDGFLARKFDWESDIGRLLDPIADKIFFMSVSATWIVSGRLKWTHLLTAGVRDLGVFGMVGRAALSGDSQRYKHVYSLEFGKLTTVIQYLILFSVLSEKKPHPFLVSSAGAVGLAALIQYFFVFHKREEVPQTVH